jgi:hypothetical protein
MKQTTKTLCPKCKKIIDISHQAEMMMDRGREQSQDNLKKFAEELKEEMEKELWIRNRMVDVTTLNCIKFIIDKSVEEII